jgi:predicted SnoaL-like aldol condensation-catalyzing enzyme
LQERESLIEPNTENSDYLATKRLKTISNVAQKVQQYQLEKTKTYVVDPWKKQKSAVADGEISMEEYFNKNSF